MLKKPSKVFWIVMPLCLISGLSGAIALYLHLTTATVTVEKRDEQLYDTRWDEASSTLQLYRTNADSAKTLTEAIDRFNAAGDREGNRPFARLVKVNFDTVFIAIDSAHYLTQRMGTTGAIEYLALLTFTVTESENINFVDLDFIMGDHANPGTYQRTDFDPEDL